MNGNRKMGEMDMLHGPLLGKILLFTLPIALSSMLQQLFNAADTSIVGYFGNSDALAAVGTNGEIIALIVTLSSGLSIGANVLIASRIGKKKWDDLSEIAQTSIQLAVLIGILGLTVGQCAARPLLKLIQTPEEILLSAESYLRIYLMGYPFLLLYDFGAAMLRARGDSRYPFVVLTISGVANVVLNLLFVVVFHMNVEGVAIATDLSTMFSALMVLYRLKKDPMFHLSIERPRIRWDYGKEILKMGIPSAIQGAVFCFANIFVQAAVNGFGPTAIAGSTIAMNFEYFAYYGITAFGQTTTTFTSQNYAAGQISRCRKILGISMVSSILCSLFMIVPMVLWQRTFSGLFSSDPSVIQSASVRILCILFYEPVCSLYEIPSGTLRAAGHPVCPAVATITGTCVFRILWICTIFQKYHTLPMLYHAFPISWALTILLIVISCAVTKPFSSAHLEKKFPAKYSNVCDK